MDSVPPGAVVSTFGITKSSYLPIETETLLFNPDSFESVSPSNMDMGILCTLFVEEMDVNNNLGPNMNTRLKLKGLHEPPTILNKDVSISKETQESGFLDCGVTRGGGGVTVV